MANIAKKAIMQALIEGVLTDLMVKTNVENVALTEGGTETTLAAKLAEIIATLNTKASTNAMNTAISTAIDKLIGGAPATYDTLKEIADYIASHKSAADALTAAIGGKVDKVSGKGLSTNDFTAALLTKLNGIAAGAQANVIESIKVNGVAQAVSGKLVDLSIPAAHTHANKAVLDGIDAVHIANWNGKSKVYVQATQPAGLAAGDLWIQTLE